MKTNSLVNWKTMTAESTLTAEPRRKKQGVVKLLTPAAQPDENMVRRLNALAARHPFCRSHRVKKHDTL